VAVEIVLVKVEGSVEVEGLVMAEEQGKVLE
jgi:hypothetical protein